MYACVNVYIYMFVFIGLTRLPHLYLGYLAGQYLDIYRMFTYVYKCKYMRVCVCVHVYMCVFVCVYRLLSGSDDCLICTWDISQVNI